MNENICSRKIDLYHLVCGTPLMDCLKPILPRVPCNKIKGENTSIERICTAPSLDECLTGIGPNVIGLHFLRELIRQNKKNVDLSKVPLPFTVVKFNVDRKDPDVLFPGKTIEYVPDAWMTQECWLTKPTMPEEIKQLWLVDAVISEETFLYQGEKWNYWVITDAKWSETEQEPNFEFVKRLYETVKEWLEQENGGNDMRKLIVDGTDAKVYENENGTYAVHVKRNHNFDGIVESTWDVEIFEEDGIHSGGGYCIHNFPLKYPDDGKTIKERAIAYADSYNNKSLNSKILYAKHEKDNAGSNNNLKTNKGTMER